MSVFARGTSEGVRQRDSLWRFGALPGKRRPGLRLFVKLPNFHVKNVIHAMIGLKKIEHDLQPLLRKLGPYFESEHTVDIAYLFGSRAAGEERRLSDVDIGLLLKTSIPRFSYLDRRLAFMKDLARIVQTDEIDVIILNEAPITLAYHAIKQRSILYERSPEVRVRFETHVIDRYLDSAPLRAVQLSYLRHQIREGSLFGQP